MIALDYHLRSKDLAYFLRLTLRDQALAVHRSEFPKQVKTYMKICEVLKSRFDSNTKREKNTKVLKRIDSSTFLNDASGSSLRAFNALVLRIEQLSAIATEDQQSDKAKITNLMDTIEPMHWNLAATAGVEAIPHFTGAVQKINHELGKIATSIPNFDEPKSSHETDRYKVKRDILLALGLQDNDESSNSDNSEDNDNVRSSDSDENKAAVINFGGKRRYGRPSGKYQRHNNSFGRKRCKRYDRDKGSSREGDQKPFEQKCFNCGSPVCRLSTCAEPKNQTRIEANL